MCSDNIIKKIALSFIPGAGPTVIRRLVSYCGGIDEVFESSYEKFTKVQGIGQHLAKKIIAGRNDAIERAKQEYEYIINNDIEFISCFDKAYPNRLKQCDDAPTVLYYRGAPAFNTQKILAVVGTRKPTRYSVDMCVSIMSELIKRHKNIVVVSGLAYGVDACSHKEALKNSIPTWAVLGHGLDLIYPKKHTSMANQIIEQNGAVITEFQHKCYIDPSNFVKRNRIIAGLADAVLIIDSGRKGGSMITADLANQYNRDVFAVPGLVNRKGGNGCNLLIKSHRANLVESYKDIEYITGWDADALTKSNAEPKMSIPENLSDNEIAVIEILKEEQYVDLDYLTKNSGLNTSTVSLVLLELEFKNIVRSLPGKIFSLIKN